MSAARTTNAWALAVEGGGTRTRILLEDPDGAIAAREFGGPASGLYTVPEKYARALAVLLRRVKRVADQAGGRVAVAGIGGPMNRGVVERTLRDVFGPLEVIAAGETQIAFALYGLAWGVSLVAGTGSSCCAVNERGQVSGCGGFGPQFGDAGSGYWIGRRAVSAAMRQGDGRGAPTVLTEKICAFYGIARVWDVLRFVDRSGFVAGPKVAALTPCVFEAAREGDAVALEICREAGRELGKLAVAAARKTAWRRRPVPLVLTGGVFNGGGLILTPLKRVLRRCEIRWDVLPPVPDPTEGILKFIRAVRRNADEERTES